MTIDWDANVLAPLEKVFGQPVTYLPQNGPPFGVSGIFDEAYRELDLVSGMRVSTVVPVLGVRLSEFASPPRQDDQLIIQATGLTYVVKEVRPDSHGAAKLMLNLVQAQ